MRAAVLAPYAFWTLLSSMARADVPNVIADSKSKPDKRVTLVVAADENTGAAFESRLEELAERLDVSLATTRVSTIDPGEIVFGASDGSMARVWIDASHADVAIVYLEGREGSHLLMRRVELAGGMDEVAREQIGQIVRASVEALLSGATIGITRTEAAAALGLPLPIEAVEKTKGEITKNVTPPSPVAKANEARWQATLGAGFATAWWTPRDLSSGPVAGISLSRVVGPYWLGGALGFEYRLPIETATAPVALRMQGWSARLLATAKRPLSDRLSFQLGLGGGLDGTSATPKLPTGERAAVVEQPAFGLSPVLRAEMGVGVAVTRGLHTTLVLTGDLDLAPRDYVVRHESGTAILAHPLALRPGLALRIAGDLVH